MEHSEFLEEFRLGSGHKTRYLIGEKSVSMSFVKSKLESTLGLSVEEWYMQCRGLEERPKCNCGDEVIFVSLSRGFSNYCSISCASREHAEIQWRKNYEFMKNATKDALTGCRGGNTPASRTGKNLKQFSGYSSLKIYLIGNENFFKFGITCKDSRIEMIRRNLQSSFCEVYEMESELACRVEGEMISIGETFDTGLELGPRMGKSEIRDIKYLPEAREFIISRLEM